MIENPSPDARRWAPPEGVTAPSSRWAHWAQALAGRYGRVARRPAGPAMVLAQPLPLYLRCQRWEQAAWALSPRIHLAIQSILQQTGQPSVWRGAHPMIALARRPEPVPLSAGNGVPGAAARPLAGNGAPGRAARPSAVEGARREKKHVTWMTPLHRVFARVARDELLDALTVARVQRQSIAVEESHRLLRRVVEARLRAEERPVRGSLVTRRQARPATEAASTGNGHGAMPDSPGWSATVPTMPAAAAPAAIDITRLTDEVVRQLDRRLVAHRERLGRTF